MFLNGESLIQRPFSERRKILHENFIKTPGEFHFASFKDASDPEVISEYLQVCCLLDKKL